MLRVEARAILQADATAAGQPLATPFAVLLLLAWVGVSFAAAAALLHHRDLE